ncbi:MAG: recombination mediator RecR [Acholeplasmatales bacterium]|nr:recombination mediator RecR [Acholeplasmatales bacterium]
MNYPRPIEDLISSFMRLPGIGRKTAERLALYAYSNMSEDEAKQFGQNFINLKKNLHTCPICGNLTEKSTCDICSDSTRNHSQIMVVETVKDLFIMENLGQFKGVYHVLNGAIDFTNGIGVEDIRIAPLLERVKEGNISEVILACNATLQGETTSRYIKTLLEDSDCLVTRLAHGLPIGGDLSYADEMTVLKALEGRIKY